MVRYCVIIAPANVPLRRTGYAGGLKAIERMLGIARGRDMIWIAGFDAVRLWHEYERGRGDALELLLKYNRGDVVDLETIIEPCASGVR